ncbi:hypothetical protein BJX64DRAFT_292527 [Aspergillus heterothallicus]
MADSAVGVIQLVDFTARVARRLNESLHNTGETPDYLREISLDLPLIIATLEQTSSDIKIELYSDSTTSTLTKLIGDCTADINKIEDVLAQTRPSASDSKRRRLHRAIRRSSSDRVVRDISARLLRTVDRLVLIQSAASVKALNGIRAGQREPGAAPSTRNEDFEIELTDQTAGKEIVDV